MVRDNIYHHHGRIVRNSKTVGPRLQSALHPDQSAAPPPTPTQMAHYANDCWDGEIECSYGWVECVGLADRSAYDLTAHAKMSKIELTAHEKFAEPRMVDQLKASDGNFLLAVLKRDFEGHFLCCCFHYPSYSQPSILLSPWWADCPQPEGDWRCLQEGGQSGH